MLIKPPKWRPPIVNAVENIVRCLDNGEVIGCTGEDGKAALEIAIAFHETSRRKKKVQLPLRNRVLKVLPRQTSFTKTGKLQ